MSLRPSSSFSLSMPPPPLLPPCLLADTFRLEREATDADERSTERVRKAKQETTEIKEQSADGAARGVE